MKDRIAKQTDLIVKECMEWEQRILHSACLAYLSAEEIHKDYHLPTLPLPLLKQEVQFMKKKYRPECSVNELGGYENVPVSEYKVMEIEKNQPTWRINWLRRYPKNKYYYLAAPQELRIDPTYCPIRRRRAWDSFKRYTDTQRNTWLNYPVLPAPAQGRTPTEKYMVDTLEGVINQLKGIPDLACIMLCKIAKMISTCITKFNQME